jgi:hypothetical protein
VSQRAPLRSTIEACHAQDPNTQWGRSIMPRAVRVAAAGVTLSLGFVLVPTAAIAADVYSSGTKVCASNRTAWVEGTSRGETYQKPPGSYSRYKGTSSAWKHYISYSPYGNGGGAWRIDAYDPYAGLTNVGVGCHTAQP